MGYIDDLLGIILPDADLRWAHTIAFGIVLAFILRTLFDWTMALALFLFGSVVGETIKNVRQFESPRVTVALIILFGIGGLGLSQAHFAAHDKTWVDLLTGAFIGMWVGWLIACGWDNFKKSGRQAKRE